MEIRVRHIERSSSSFLHDGSMMEAFEIMASMRVVGVCIDDLDRTHQVTHQFTAGEDGAFLEIVVGEEG